MTISRSVFWPALAAVAAFGGIALMPAADPVSSGLGVAQVAASASPNAAWFSERGTQALDSIKGTAALGTPAAAGPSANQGQNIQFKGIALAPGSVSFSGYNGTSVSSPLTNVKVGKKGKAVVPPLAISGPLAILPTAGEPTNALNLQIVPTISSLSTKTVTIGGELTINGTGFDPGVRVVVPGIVDPLAPTTFDNDTAVITIPTGARKGKVMVVTSGGTSNASKIKVAATAVANRLLATDPQTGLILATDDVANTLSAYDPASGAIVWTVAVGFGPEALAVAAATREAVVMAEGWAPVTVNLDTGAARGGFPDERPGQDSSVDVERFSYARELRALDPRIELVTVSLPTRILAVNGDLGLLYVVDLETLEPVAVHRFDGPVGGVAVGLDGRVYTVDRATGRLLSVPVE